MAELKTKRNKRSVREFLGAVKDVQRRKDSLAVARLMADATGLKAEMWGDSIVGFGSYHYKYASGQEGDWPLVGFSPRKQNLTIYIMPGFAEYTALLGTLGPHTTGRSCLYLKSLDQVHLPTLRKLVRQSTRHMKKIVAERTAQGARRKS